MEYALHECERLSYLRPVNTETTVILLLSQSDAVVSSVADRMKISKADILNPDSDGAAVKLALAETHVIQETKKYLEDVSATPFRLVSLQVHSTLPGRRTFGLVQVKATK